MKFFTVAAITLASFGSAAADTCSELEHANAYTNLAVLMSMDSFFNCANDADYSLLYSTDLPNQEQLNRMCASEDCNSMIATINSLNPPNCDLTVITSGLTLNVADLSSKFPSQCASLGITVGAGDSGSFVGENSTTYDAGSSGSYDAEVVVPTNTSVTAN